MHLNLVEAAVSAATALVVPAALFGLAGEPGLGTYLPSAETVEVASAAFDYPLPGEFLAGGRPTTAPSERIKVPPFRIMRQQVSLADYSRCVAEGVCEPADATPTAADVPITGVNWLDADAYARWYSEATGESWRLPTTFEAAAAAAERFAGEPFPAAADDPANPAVRWLRRYREEAATRRPADPQPKRRGHYGINSLGVEDFGGNVWEWTSTCYSRVTLDGVTRALDSITENCGVHVLEGKHRAYMSNFVRDGKSGGCAVGTPPENLGFRLVHEESSIAAALKSGAHKMLSGYRFEQAENKP